MVAWTAIILALLWVVPLAIIPAILILDKQTPPHQRTIRAFTTGILLHYGIIVCFTLISSWLQNQLITWLPLVILSLPLIGMARIAQITNADAS